MIVFNKVRWKNFLSTGNSFTEIELDKHSTTLIIGENGSGKSTILDAICFGLFGKPYRNINKPQLVNTINNKQCVVEIEFRIGKKEFKIIRGIKPAVFEIWLNGEMINQDAASRDYQSYLEENILKLNYKSFTQIVILGAASFTPFMQLPAAARREVIEDILDIKIFSSMNVVLRQKISELKDKMVDVEAKIEIAKNKAEVQQTYIKKLQNDREERINEIEKNIKEAKTENEKRQDDYVAVSQRHIGLSNSISDFTSVRETFDDIVKTISNLETEASKTEKEINFFHNTSNCPKCKQGIPHDFKKDIIDTYRNGLVATESSLEKSRKKMAKVNERLDKIKYVNKELEKLANEMSEIQKEINVTHRIIQRLELEKQDIIKKVDSIDDEKKKLKDLATEALEVAKTKSELNETSHYYDIVAVMLKDSGIKTRIIKQYLPVINKLVNKYLAAMDFFVQFTLDEKFAESIKSRYRDDFSYESFSEGEKQRIDLALLFTWRTIAKLKNSASTNLLILDEVFDSSLDTKATDQVMALLNTLGEETNVWVISHKGDQLFDKFAHIKKFEKKKNFSVIV